MQMSRDGLVNSIKSFTFRTLVWLRTLNSTSLEVTVKTLQVSLTISVLLSYFISVKVELHTEQSQKKKHTRSFFIELTLGVRRYWRIFWTQLALPQFPSAVYSCWILGEKLRSFGQKNTHSTTHHQCAVPSHATIFSEKANSYIADRERKNVLLCKYETNHFSW